MTDIIVAIVVIALVMLAAVALAAYLSWCMDEWL